jgi:hypothetical protein
MPIRVNCGDCSFPIPTPFGRFYVKTGDISPLKNPRKAIFSCRHSG